MAGELISDGVNLFINSEYAEVYVPEDIIDSPDGEPSDSSVAYEYGEGYVLFGILYCRFFESEANSRNDTPLRTLVYPTLIETYPTDSTTLVLTLNGITDKFRVFKYYKGDNFMQATSVKSSQNVEAFMRLLASGKLPRSLSYDDVYGAWMDCYNINGMTPNAPAVVLQSIVAEMYRNQADPSQQFSKVIGRDPKTNPYSYLPMNMNAVSAYSSVISALSFERMEEKLTSSLNMTKSGTKQKKSPIEDIISM